MSLSRSFSECFAEAWERPTAEGLGALLAEDILLVQPHLPPIRGRDAAIREFGRLFSWLPGTHSEVVRWLEGSDVALIEHVLHFPVGSSFIRIPAVDRFTLKDGLAVERVVYFDQVPLVLGVLGHPSLWLGFIKYRFGRGSAGA